MKKILSLFAVTSLLLLQTACISAPTIPTGTSSSATSASPNVSTNTDKDAGTSANSGNNAKEEKANPKDFKRTDYAELPQYQQKLSRVLLDYEHSHDVTDISHQLKNEIARSPAVAKYLIDHDLIRQDANYADYLSQIALRTIIQSGQVDPYLDRYWGHVLYQSDVNWFYVGFVAQAGVTANL